MSFADTGPGNRKTGKRIEEVSSAIDRLNLMIEKLPPNSKDMVGAATTSWNSFAELKLLVPSAFLGCRKEEHASRICTRVWSAGPMVGETAAPTHSPRSPRN
jgi:hypothetical protein